jgi:hypothetical protein
VADEDGFRAGKAYLDLDVRDQTPEGLRRIKERVERGDHLSVPVKLADVDNQASFETRLLEAVKSIKPQVTVTLSDPVTPEWKRKTKDETEKQPPLKVPVTAVNPIDAAWRAKVNAAIKTIASDTLQIPVTPDTAELRASTQAAVAELSKTLKTEIPADLAEADKFKAQVELLAKEVSETVKAKIPVEIDPDKGKKEAERAGADIAKSFTGTFSNGIAPMPALIGAAILAGAPLVGGAMIGIAGAGMAGAAVAISAGSPDVVSRWMALGDQMSRFAEDLRPRLTAPIVNALDTVRNRFSVLSPQIGNDLISAEGAIKPLTDGVLGLAQNAMPGLSLAVARQGPVMDGFKTLLEQAGTAVSDTFESLSLHSQAFGTDTASLGAIVRSAMSLITQVVNTAGEAWARNSGQITGAIGQLMSGLGALAGSAIPALTSELANVLSVLGFMASVAGDVSHALGPLSGDIMAVAISAKLLGVNLTSIPKQLGELPGKLADVAEGGGKFAGVAGLLGDALPVVGAGLGVVAAGLGAVAIGASMAAQHEQDLIDTGTKLGQSIVSGGTAASDAAKKLNDMEDNANKLKVQIQQLSTQQDTAARSAYTMNGGFSASAAQSQQYQSQLQDLNLQLKTATDAENSYKEQLGPLGVAQARAAQAQKDYNDAISKYGAGSSEAEAASRKLASANAEVTSQQQNLNNAMSLTKAAMGTFEKPAIQLQADLAKIGDAASSDSDKINAMKDALIRLSGGAIPVGDAMEAIDKAMAGISTQMAQGINHADGYGKALLNADGSVRTVTKNGQSLRDVMTDLRGKFVDAAAAIVAEDEAQGKSADQAKAHAQAVLQQQIPAVEKLGETMGLTKDQVDAALKSMGAWPADLVTVVATPGAVQAQQAMDILKGKVLDVPNDHTVHTQALTDAAIQQLRDLGLVVTTLPNGTVTITGNTDLALAAANSLIRTINGMRAVITVDAKGNTSSVHVVDSRSTANATGNLYVPMADGGFAGPPLTPMSNQAATVVAPNTWRISGDRKDVPELFAPLDGSARSKSLISQAAAHEGISVAMPAQRSVTINQTVTTSDPQQAADRAAGAVAWAMSSARG